MSKEQKKNQLIFVNKKTQQTYKPINKITFKCVTNHSFKCANINIKDSKTEISSSFYSLLQKLFAQQFSLCNHEFHINWLERKPFYSQWSFITLFLLCLLISLSFRFSSSKWNKLINRVSRILLHKKIRWTLSLVEPFTICYINWFMA